MTVWSLSFGVYVLLDEGQEGLFLHEVSYVFFICGYNLSGVYSSFANNGRFAGIKRFYFPESCAMNISGDLLTRI